MEESDYFKPRKLDDQLISEIRQLVESGVYPLVAARACGVPERQFKAWMKRGNKQRTYARLRNVVLTAHARARAYAETRVWRSDPKTWLKAGPARERTPTDPGWGDGKPDQESADQIEVKFVADRPQPKRVGPSSDDGGNGA